MQYQPELCMTIHTTTDVMSSRHTHTHTLQKSSWLFQRRTLAETENGGTTPYHR